MRTSFIVALLAMNTADSSAVRLDTEFGFSDFGNIASGVGGMAAAFSGNEDVAKYTNMGVSAGTSFADGNVGDGIGSSLNVVGGGVGGTAGDAI